MRARCVEAVAGGPETVSHELGGVVYYFGLPPWSGFGVRTQGGLPAFYWLSVRRLAALRSWEAGC